MAGIDDTEAQNSHTQTFDEQGEPYAMDVERKCCKICRSGEFTDYSIKKHFMLNHPNVSVEYDFVKSEKLVACSACSRKMQTKNFERHRNKVHAVAVKEEKNTDQSGEEPYAIDVLVYNCKLCKVGGVTEKLLKKHFKVKHHNAPYDFNAEPGNSVKCSSCEAKMLRENFDNHKTKVHRKISQFDAKDVKHAEQPYAIVMMAMKCKVCGEECVGRQSLKKHFAAKHRGVAMEVVVEKSDKFVRCSACKIQVFKERFTRHKHRCTQVEAPINTGSLLVSQMTNIQTFQQGQVDESSEFNRPSAKGATEECKEHRSRYSSPQKKLNVGNNLHTEAPKLFVCRTCDARNILEQHKMKHHLEHHSTDSKRQFSLKALDYDFYVSTSSSEWKSAALKVKCEVCLVELNKSHFQRHMRRAHSKSIAINEKQQPTTKHFEERTVRDDIFRQLVAFKLFKCLACDARDIMEPNLVKHHLKKHTTIPMEINIFQATASVLREICDICQKFLHKGRLNQHKKRSHPKRIVNIAPTADTPVCCKNVLKRTLIQHTEPVPTELHKCVKCKAVVSRDNIEVHRKNHHSTKTGKLFKLIGTKDVIKCTACLQFIDPKMFMKHIQQHRSLIFVSVDGEPLLSPEQDNRRTVTYRKTKHLPKYRNIYKCRICEITEGKDVFIGDTDLDGEEIQKHHRKHDKDSVKGSIFQLFVVKVKCNLCDRFMREGCMEGHMKKVHNWNYDFTQLYECGCCDAHGISKRNLAVHHARMHSNVPFARNNFKVHASRQKIVCDLCGKRYMEGRQNKHQLKSCLQRANVMVLERGKAAAFRDGHLRDSDDD